MSGPKVNEIVGGCEGGTIKPALSGIASVITRKLVSCPVIPRMLLVMVARRESELVHCTPSIRTLKVLPPFGVAVGGGAVVSVTLNVPSVIVLVPVAPDPATGASEKEKVPTAFVDVSVVIVMLPLPVPTPPDQP